MMAQNARSELRVFPEEERILSSGCPVSFEGKVVTVRREGARIERWREKCQ
jgi:hypothetical protein